MSNINKVDAPEKSIKYDNQFYKIMVEYLGEEIFVADGKGKVLFVNPASAATIGLPVDQIIGRNAGDLEREGYFTNSCTMEVIRQRKLVNAIQKLRDGRSVLATGLPIFDDDQKEIIMVVTTSKDVDAVNNLLATVEEQTRTLEEKDEEILRLQEELFVAEGFISANPKMRELKNAVMKLASLDVTVLIEGETGVGKEVMVRALHRFSDRTKAPLIKINCGIIPENLMESELFGYEEGAFTGASKQGKKGKVELADGGTLFLDEIGELPLSLQVKLLELLQDNSFTAVGSNVKKTVNARIVAATNRDLKEMCDKGLFRQDLYYRLNVIPIRIPPLRERVEDIAVLSKYFLSNYNSKYNSHKKIEKAALDILVSYDWPGNIRELEHVLERAFIVSEGDLLTAESLKHLLYEAKSCTLPSKVICTELMPLKEAKQEVERQLLKKAEEIYNSTYKMADALQIDQSTVVKLLKKHREL